MTASKFKRITSTDDELNRVQSAVAVAVDPLLSIPLLDGRYIEAETDSRGNEVALVIPAAPAFKAVSHKLGRDYRGWIVCSQSAAATVYESTSLNQDRTKFIYLSAGAVPATVKLWVF